MANLPLDYQLGLNNAYYKYAASIGNWKAALDYFIKVKNCSDTMNVQSQRRKIFEAEQKFNVSQKEADIAKLETKNLLQEKNRRSLITIGIIGFLLLVIVILALFLYNRRQQFARKLERDALANDLQKMEEEMKWGMAHSQAETELAMANQRKHISKNLHDGLSSSLATLKYYITDLKTHTDDEKTKTLLENVAEETEEVYQQARTFMHNLYNTSAQSQYNVLDFLHNLNVRYGAESSLKIGCEANENAVRTHFTAMQHQELYLIIKEAVVNAIKHSQANKMHISLQLENNQFLATIKDNGIGMTVAEGAGLGLKNMRERIEQLRGSLQINSNSNGLLLTVRFPVGIKGMSSAS